MVTGLLLSDGEGLLLGVDTIDIPMKGYEHPISARIGLAVVWKHCIVIMMDIKLPCYFI